MLGAAITMCIVGTAFGQGLPCGYTLDLVYGPACGGGANASVFGSGISDEGDLCGWFQCPFSEEDAFVAWNAGTLSPVSLPAGINQSMAIDVNGDVVVGHYASPGGYRGFRRQGASFTTIEPLAGGNWVEVSRANPAGIIVGAWGNSVTGPFPKAYRWANGVLQDISTLLVPGKSRADGISDSGLITGYMGRTAFPSNARAFIWNNGQVVDLGIMPGAIGTEATGINDNLQVCGIAWYTSANSAGYVRRGFFWQNGVFTDLGSFLGFTEVFPKDIANDGTIAGWAVTAPGQSTTKAFLWKAGVLVDLSVAVGSTVNYIDLPRGVNETSAVGAIAGTAGQIAGVRLIPTARRVGDTNCDQVVNVTDLLAVINAWGSTGVAADVNADFVVNVSDLLLVISNWG